MFIIYVSEILYIFINKLNSPYARKYWQQVKCRINSVIVKLLKIPTYIWTQIIYPYFTLNDC